MSNFSHHRGFLIRLFAIAFVGFVAAINASAQEPAPGASPPWIRGAPSAEVTIEIFNDYECPPCRLFNEDVKYIESQFGDRVRIVFRNYPLKNIHKHALDAAKAAEAAGLQGKFSEMIELLYAKWSEWAESEKTVLLFSKYAVELGLDQSRFELDMNSEDVLSRIRLDVERAKSLQVTGTPTLFINDKMVSPLRDEILKEIRKVLR